MNKSQQDTKAYQEEYHDTWTGKDMAVELQKAFIAGAERERLKAIEAHWKCCPNLSKDNDRICNHLADCDRQCLYMNEFIYQLLIK